MSSHRRMLQYIGLKIRWGGIFTLQNITKLWFKRLYCDKEQYCLNISLQRKGKIIL